MVPTFYIANSKTYPYSISTKSMPCPLKH